MKSDSVMKLLVKNMTVSYKLKGISSFKIFLMNILSSGGVFPFETESSGGVSISIWQLF